MNNMAKIFSLSFFLLTQQSYAMGIKLFLCGYFFTTAALIPAAMLSLSSWLNDIKKSKKLKTEFENTKYNFTAAHAKHLQVLEEKLNLSGLSSISSKFFTYIENIEKKKKEITASGRYLSLDDRKKDIEYLTSVFQLTTECLKTIKEKENWARSEKIQEYDSCVDKAFAQQKENNEHETKFLEKPKTKDD